MDDDQKKKENSNKMIKSRDELMEMIKNRLPSENRSDEDVTFLEDITDTIEDYEKRVKDSTDWKCKYEENDREWKKKYTDRFFSKEPDEPDESANDEIKPKTFADLFKTEGV